MTTATFEEADKFLRAAHDALAGKKDYWSQKIAASIREASSPVSARSDDAVPALAQRDTLPVAEAIAIQGYSVVPGVAPASSPVMMKTFERIVQAVRSVDRLPDVTRRTFLQWLAAGVFASVVGCGKEDKENPAPQPPVLGLMDTDAGLNWLINRIDPATNLIASFVDIPVTDSSYGVTWIFNQAQAIEAFLAAGDLARARQLTKRLMALQESGGAWRNAYITATGAPSAKTIEHSQRWTGPNVAAGAVILEVAALTPEDPSYLESAQQLAGWLDPLFNDFGDFGFLKGGDEVPWVATEHNMRAMPYYAMLFAQTGLEINNTRLTQTSRWLNERMFAGDHYDAGLLSVNLNDINGDFNIATDIQAIAPIMAFLAGLDPLKFAGGLDWLLEWTTQREYNGTTLTGIPRWLTLGSSVWAEGTSYLAAALMLVGRDQEAVPFLNTLGAIQVSGGGILAAIGEPSQGWPGDFRYSAVEATAPAIVATFGLPEHIAAKPLPASPATGGASSPVTGDDQGKDGPSASRKFERTIGLAPGDKASSPVVEGRGQGTGFRVQVAGLRGQDGEPRQFIWALWFNPDYYWLWEKMLLKPHKKIRCLIVLNVPEALKEGSMIRVQGTGYRVQRKIARTTNDEIRATSSPVGAVIVVSSSPVADWSDPVWAAYRLKKVEQEMAKAKGGDTGVVFHVSGSGSN